MQHDYNIVYYTEYEGGLGGGVGNRMHPHTNA
jgi:hypothetical protein